MSTIVRFDGPEWLLVAAGDVKFLHRVR